MMGESPLVFISHSNTDQETAKALARLLQSALNLTPAEIRCTSVEGYRLPAGAQTDEQLRDEIKAATAMVGLISPGGMSSAYVLFELGARWGARKYLAPLLTPGTDPKILQGPIAGLNALRCDSEEQMHEFLHELASKLGRQVNSPAAYLSDLRAVCQSRYKPPTTPPTAQDNQSTAPLELAEEHVAILGLLAVSERYLYDTDVASRLGWPLTKALHYLDVLRDGGYVVISRGEYDIVYHLGKKGRAFAVKHRLVT